MPMIDVYAAADLSPPGTDRQLGEELTLALLRAEGVDKPGPTHLNNTGAYLHRMPATAVNTAASGSARTVRVQVLTPPGALKRSAPRQLRADGGFQGRPSGRKSSPLSRRGRNSQSVSRDSNPNAVLALVRSGELGFVSGCCADGHVGDPLRYGPEALRNQGIVQKHVALCYLAVAPVLPGDTLDQWARRKQHLCGRTLRN